MRTFNNAWIIRILYLLPFPGLVRLVGHLGTPCTAQTLAQAQYVMVQAFGRGSYPDKTLTAKLAAVAKPAASPLTSSFLALEADDFRPGRANMALAGVCLQLWRLHPPLVIIAQWEVCYSLWLTDRKLIAGPAADRLICLWPQGSYYATVHVKRATVHSLLARGFSSCRGLELAHPDMAARAQLILWRLGVCPALLVADIPFGPDSVQWWTRSPWQWFVREYAGRIQHVLWGWVAWRPHNHE